MKTQSSERKTVVVTGGSRGIGRGICEVLQANGKYRCIAIGKNQASPYLPSGVEYTQADLSSEKGFKQAIKLIEENEPEVLINCVGIERNGSFLDTTPESVKQVIDTNLMSHVWLTQAALRSMKRLRWGRIIFITSVWASLGTRNRAIYSMTKGAIQSLALSLADEFAVDGIRINCIAPGFMDIDETAHPGRGEARKAFLAEHVPLKRLGHPCEVGKLARWLISDESDYLNGQILFLDGGFSTSGARGSAF